MLGVENRDILTSDERVLGTDFHDPVAVRCPHWDGTFNEVVVQRTIVLTQ